MTKSEVNKVLSIIEELREKAESAAEAYREECELLGDEVGAFIDEKTERWQEGVNGSAWVELRDQLSMVDFDISEAPELNL